MSVFRSDGPVISSKEPSKDDKRRAVIAARPSQRRRDRERLAVRVEAEIEERLARRERKRRELA